MNVKSLDFIRFVSEIIGYLNGKLDTSELN